LEEEEGEPLSNIDAWKEAERLELNEGEEGKGNRPHLLSGNCLHIRFMEKNVKRSYIGEGTTGDD